MSFLNRKTQLDTSRVTVLIIIFLFGVSLFIAVIVYQEFYQATIPTELLVNESATIITNFANTYVVTDYMVLFLTVGLILALFISGYMIYSHPLFLGFTILMGFVDILLAVSLSNAFNTIASEQPSIALLIPITSWIIARFPLVATLCIVSFGLGLYAKPAQQGGGGQSNYGY